MSHAVYAVVFTRHAWHDSAVRMSTGLQVVEWLPQAHAIKCPLCSFLHSHATIGLMCSSLCASTAILTMSWLSGVAMSSKASLMACSLSYQFLSHRLLSGRQTLRGLPSCPTGLQLLISSHLSWDVSLPTRRRWISKLVVSNMHFEGS